MPDVTINAVTELITIQENTNSIVIYDGKFSVTSLGNTVVTTINKVTITQPATNATLTIQEGFTLTANGSATVSGTNTGDNAVNSEYDGKLSGITMANLSTGILLNTTGTGEPSIAVAADFPTLNQNTSGTAAGLSTTLIVGEGGTGLGTLTANNVILGAGTSAVTFVAPGTVGNVLTSDGTTWTSAANAGGGGSYLPLAGGAMDANALVTLSDTSTNRDTEIGGWGLGTQKTSDHNYSATFEYDQILIKDGSQTTTIKTNTITTGGSYIERQVAASFTAGVMTLDCEDANVFTCALTGNVSTFTINNIPTSGQAIGITLILTADGTQRTIAWPAAFRWAGGVAPTITATNAKKDAIVFMTYDAGSSFLAFVAGQNL